MIEVSSVTAFISEVRLELRKVVWPSRQESIRLTAVVLAVSALLALYLGLLDFMLTESLKSFVKR